MNAFTPLKISRDSNQVPLYRTSPKKTRVNLRVGIVSPFDDDPTFEVHFHKS